jgi:hypothetical protein
MPIPNPIGILETSFLNSAISASGLALAAVASYGLPARSAAFGALLAALISSLSRDADAFASRWCAACFYTPRAVPISSQE